jgi:hypothetical protein
MPAPTAADRGRGRRSARRCGGVRVGAPLRFGFIGDAALVAEMMRVEAIAGHAAQHIAMAPAKGDGAPVAHVETFMSGALRMTPVFDRAARRAGASRGRR